MSTTHQDPRASAAEANVKEPTLLYTFLGRVSSRKGREFERVLAVMVSRDGKAQLMTTASEWTPLADPTRAIRTTGIWEDHFEGWSDKALETAQKAAEDGFIPLAGSFTQERKASLESERTAQKEWLKKRSEEISGTGVSEKAYQAELFGPHGNGSEPKGAAPAWASITDPDQRLAAFASDRSQRPSHRSEADGVLRIYQQRTRTLDMLTEIRSPEVILLGVLMLIPEVPHGS